MKKLMMILMVMAVVVLLAGAAFAATDVNTGQQIADPPDSSVMPWDAAPYVGPVMDPEREKEWMVFFSGVMFLFAVIAL